MATKTQRQFLATESLVTRVQLAQSLARELVLVGPSTTTREELLSNYIEQLIGHEGPAPTDVDDLFIEKLEQYGGAAYALGLAVGLLLRSEAFAKGGGR